MKKAILLLLSSLFITFTLSAQDLIDVVYLKNGKKVEGSVIKPLDENGVKIMTASSDVFHFDADEVRKVTREEMTHQDVSNSVMAHDGEGFTNMTGVTFGFGIGSYDVGNQSIDNDEGYFGIHTINGYHLNEKLSLGLGLGVDFFNTSSSEQGAGDGYELLPIYADVRFMPVRKVWAPFFYGNAGYALGAFESNVDGGAMLGLGGGAQWSLSRSSALTASVGYRFQSHNFESIDGFNAHYLNFKVGFKF